MSGFREGLKEKCYTKRQKKVSQGRFESSPHLVIKEERIRELRNYEKSRNEVWCSWYVPCSQLVTENFLSSILTNEISRTPLLHIPIISF